MQTLRMKTELLPALLVGLKPWGTLYAPVERSAGVFSLEALDDGARARPDAVRTIIPFKKLLLKPAFTMLEQHPHEAPHESRDNDEDGPKVFFGAHACDIHSLKILDLLYLRLTLMRWKWTVLKKEGLAFFAAEEVILREIGALPRRLPAAAAAAMLKDPRRAPPLHHHLQAPAPKDPRKDHPSLRPSRRPRPRRPNTY